VRRLLLLALVLLGCAAVPAWAFARDFENPQSHDPSQQLLIQPGPNVQREDTPNDPNYDEAESDDQDKGQPGHPPSSSLYDERFDLFGFPSQYNGANARYLDPQDSNRARIGKSQVSGFNAAGAWKLERGRPDVTVAILDTGIRWANTGLRTQVHLNKGELPTPRNDHAIEPGVDCSKYTHAGYDINGDGVFNVDDYGCDARVTLSWSGRAKGSPDMVTGQDLIHAFSNGVDNDHNGFVDDIAGWDFFNNDNDPFDQSSYFAASNHGTGRTGEAVERGNDNQGSIGVCPHCQFLPVRVWDTFVSDGDTFGLGMFYATHMGAKVIEGADGNLYHSAFTEAASKYAYDKGVTQTYSGDDLNTANHNYPANYNHTMLIQGTVPDTIGLGQNSSELTKGFFNLPLPTSAPPSTYFRGANTTQFGGHSSISMEGATGSVNTGKASGAAALVVSAAKDASPSIDLTADETREILEQTAEDVLPGNTGGVGTPDPAAKGWDSHFGWGRADVGAAVAVAHSGKIPPEASIGSPDWYAPVSGTVRITGRARALRAPNGAFHWKLETCPTFQLGTGEGPCTTVREADATGTVTDFGTINADLIRASLPPNPPDPGGPMLALGGPNPFQGQFTVRLTVTEPNDPSVLPGIDRKVLTAVSDPTLRRGYPKRLGTGGEAPIRYADLNGDNIPELIVPLEDGTLHAYEPNGSELRGWPVRTGVFSQAANHAGALKGAGLAPPREPLRGAVVADIDGDGRPEVIDTAGTHLYVWEADGKLRRGFPVSIDPRLCRGSDQSQPLHHRKCGFLASPSIAHLEGRSRPPDIVAAALDGHVYAFRPDGSAVSGYPVDLVDPAMPASKRAYAESINDIAVGDLNGDGRDDLVVASNESYGAAAPNPADINAGFGQALSDVLGQAAGGSSRVYAIDGKTGRFLPGWPVKLNGAIQNVLPLIGPGHDAALLKVGGAQRIVVSTTGGALATYDTKGHVITSMDQGGRGLGNSTQNTAQLNLFEYASIGDLTGLHRPDIVKYGVTLGQAANLLLVGQNVPYEHLIGAYDAGTGKAIPGYPTVTDDYQFLSSSNVGKVAPGASNQVLAGTGLGLLHAYDGVSGQDAPGFPKVTGGWLFAPPALSDDHRIAEITREGYLFEWGAPGAPSCQTEWPSFRHDAQQTGNYDADGTPPAAPGGLTVTPLGGNRYRLSFTSPGDDGLCGTAASYVAEVGGKPVDLKLGSPVSGGRRFSREVTLPANFSSFSLRARDEAGNNGAPVALASCRDRARPTLRFGGLRGARRTIDLRGSAADGGCAGSVPARTIARRGAVRSVRLAVSVFVRGGCRFVRADGRLTSTQSCRRPLFVTARGTTRWALRVRGTFPSGRYVVRSRVYDRAGNVGRPAPRLFHIGRVPARFTG